jgi:tetratricopeptide (TPR) repeat protein
MSTAFSEATVRCQSCSKAMRSELRFCTNCGAALPAVDATVRLDEPLVLRRARSNLQNAPSTRAAWYALGLATGRAGDWQSAYQQLGNALREPDGRPPSEDSIHAALALAAAQAGNRLDSTRHTLLAIGARETVSRRDVIAAVGAIPSLPDISPLRSLGRSLMAGRGTAQALGCVVLALAGATEEALAAAPVAVESSPRTLIWALEAALRLLEADDPEVSPGPSPAVLAALGRVALMAGARRLARRAAGRVIEAGGEDDRSTGLAHEQLAEVASSEAARARHLFHAGQYLSWADEEERAAELLRGAIAIRPTKEAHWFLADCLRRIAVRPEPFATDPDGLQEAMQVWRDGLALGKPSAEYAWAYYVAALIEGHLAEVAADDFAAEAHRWNGLHWVVAGLVVRDDKWDLWAWVEITRRLRYLDLRAGASVACELMSQLATDSLDHGSTHSTADAATEEAVTAWLDLRPPSAAAALEAASRRSPHAIDATWLKLAQAWLDMREGRPKAALEPLRDATGAGEDHPVFVGGFVRALLLTGRDEEGRKVAAALGDALAPVQKQQAGWLEWAIQWAWAAMWVGRIADAEDMLERSLGQMPAAARGRFDTLVALAGCRLREDDIKGAERWLDQAFALTPSAGLLADVVNDLSTVMPKGESTGAAKLLASVRRLVRTRYRAELDALPASLTTAVDELKQGGRADPAEGATLAAIAVLLLGSNGRWRQASLAAKELVAAAGTPEAHELVRWSRARMPGELLAELADTPPPRAAEVVGEFLSSGLPSASTVARAWRAELSAAQYWALTELAAELPKGRPRRLLEGVLSRLQDWFSERFAAGPSFADSLELVPAPIVLEMGSSLVVTDAAENWTDWSLFTEMIPTMKADIQQETGVLVPGVRVRENETLMADEYVIRLEESPVAGGRVPLGQRWLEGAGDGIAQRHPRTGRHGRWMQEDHTTAEGIEPVAFTVAHLGAVLRGELARYMLADETAELAQSWASETESLAGLARILEDAEGLVWLSTLLRRLLREGVPLSQGSVIGARALAAGAGADLDDVVRQIRNDLRVHLPGNAPGAVRVDVSAMWEQVLCDDENRTPHGAPAAMLRLTETAQAALDNADGVVALVVDSAATRVQLQELLSAELPGVGVLAREEVLGD